MSEATRRVRMKVTQAGPSTFRGAGRSYDVPGAEAARIVAAGFATWDDVEPDAPPAPKPAAGAQERATAPAPESTATTPAARPDAPPAAGAAPKAPPPRGQRGRAPKG